MPADLNRVTLVGRLTRDPELRTTGSGDPVCSMRIAVNGRGRNDAGEWVDTPNFFDVSVWGRQAESCEKYLKKGSRVGVDGSLKWREWTAQDGGKRQTVDVNARDVYFLETKAEAESYSGDRSELPTGEDVFKTELPVEETTPAPTGKGDDDIPF